MVLAFNRSFTRLAHQLRVFPFGPGVSVLRSRTVVPEIGRVGCSGEFQFLGVPNLPLNSDPACVVLRSFSSFVFLGFAQCLGAGGAG